MVFLFNLWFPETVIPLTSVPETFTVPTGQVVPLAERIMMPLILRLTVDLSMPFALTIPACAVLTGKNLYDGIRPNVVVVKIQLMLCTVTLIDDPLWIPLTQNPIPGPRNVRCTLLRPPLL